MNPLVMHQISFQLKNGVEVLFQGDDQVLHVLNDYRRIFSLSKSPLLEPADRYTITFRHQPDGPKSYNLTECHFELLHHKNLGIPFNFKIEDPDDYACMLMMFSTLLGSVAQLSGGGLMHAALGELAGKGFLMAAHGGTGKSTASRRLPSPFVSLCDDTTLVVKDKNGNYWAHPYPTWSRFYWGGEGGSWIFEDVVPINMVFYLFQSETDFIAPLTSAEKVSYGVAAFDQASRWLARNAVAMDKINQKGPIGEKPVRIAKDWFAIGNDPAENLSREIRKHWFDNALMFGKNMPARKLNLSLTGKFWNLIENDL